MVLAAQEMMQEPKNERAGMGRGRKETLAYKPQVSCNVFSCWVQLVSVFLRDVKFPDLQIQILKNGLHFKLKLHQLWRISL